MVDQQGILSTHLKVGNGFRNLFRWSAKNGKEEIDR